MRTRLLAFFAVVGLLVASLLLVPEGPGARLRVAAGLTEGCVACHGEPAGLIGAHAPAAIGCVACHGGDGRTLEAKAAHEGIVLMPGHLADASRSCSQAGCHAAILPRVENSIMSTMAGVIAINRRVLGEDPGPGIPHVAKLGHGVADSHLRELCAGCHLGQSKEVRGPIGEKTQGGGCLACHLEYGAKAADELKRFEAQPKEARAAPRTHPALTVNPRNAHCFGCHSRSGRFALGFEGWHEMQGRPGADEVRGKRVRKLEDGRTVEFVVADIHHEKGLSCIDCHNANEVMGAGAPVTYKREQQRVGCEDCHAAKLASVSPAGVDPESASLLRLRGRSLGLGERMGTTRDGDPLVNVVVSPNGARLVTKHDARSLPLKPPAAACTQDRAHERLSCNTCHTAWAPSCVSCHTQYDPADEGFDHVAQQWGPGTWNETSGRFEAKPPALGVLRGGAGRGAIDTFVPGMVMTFDRNREAGKAPDVIFRRLFAKLSAHTTRREARSCDSCHRDPVALGYGAGALRFTARGGEGAWTFDPALRAHPRDGLPEDAWTGFLAERGGMVSTREGARPFHVAEQRKILAVGACLGCHAGDSPPMKRALADFGATVAARSRSCVVATFR